TANELLGQVLPGDVGEAGVLAIPARQDGIFHAPVDGQLGIIPGHAEFVVACVVVVDQVDQGGIGERDEAVGHAHGNEDAHLVVVADLNGLGCPVRGRMGAQIGQRRPYLPVWAVPVVY